MQWEERSTFYEIFPTLCGGCAAFWSINLLILCLGKLKMDERNIHNSKLDWWICVNLEFSKEIRFKTCCCQLDATHMSWIACQQREQEKGERMSSVTKAMMYRILCWTLLDRRHVAKKMNKTSCFSSTTCGWRCPGVSRRSCRWRPRWRRWRSSTRITRSTSQCWRSPCAPRRSTTPCCRLM